MFKKGKMVFYLSVLALVSLLSVNASGEVQKYDIRLGTSYAGGIWAVLGSAMLEDILKASPNLAGSSVPMGGTANVMGLIQGRLNIVFSTSDTMGEAWEGKGDFKEVGKVRNVRILGTIYPSPSQFVVYADSGITAVPQLKGKKISPGPRASSGENITRRILEYYGMTMKDVQWRPLGWGEGAEQMIDRHIDALLYGTMVYPAPPLINISSQRQIRLLSLSSEVIDKMVKNYRGFEPFTLPVGCYKGVDQAAKGITTNVVLIVREDMPDDVAYVIAKKIAENWDRYVTVTKAMAIGKVSDMGKDFGFQFHPGALKFYKEKGWVK